MKRIVCENLRSAYNVGNIIRTADALKWGVVILGYTASFDHPKVIKTSLGSEKQIPIKSIDNLSDLFIIASQENAFIVCAEKTNNSMKLNLLGQTMDNIYKKNKYSDNIYLIVGNEVTGIEQESLKKCDIICEISMLGSKESLNVGQAAAIFMREINKIYEKNEQNE